MADRVRPQRTAIRRSGNPGAVGIARLVRAAGAAALRSRGHRRRDPARRLVIHSDSAAAVDDVEPTAQVITRVQAPLLAVRRAGKNMMWVLSISNRLYQQSHF